MMSRRMLLSLTGALSLSQVATACASSPARRTDDRTSTGAEVGDGITRWTYGTHPDQYADLYRPVRTTHPGVVVVIHGGFWQSGYDSSLGAPLSADLAQRGYLAWNLEYRRLGNGGGWPSTFADVAAGIDLLAAVGDLDLTEVATIGHSAGGHLAVWAAARPLLEPASPGATPAVRVTRAVSQAGVLRLKNAAMDGVGGSTVADLIGGMPDAMPSRYTQTNPSDLLPLGVPVRALHARDDTIVPFSQSADFVAAALAAGDDAQLIEVTGGHFDLIDVDSTAWSATIAALSG